MKHMISLFVILTTQLIVCSCVFSQATMSDKKFYSSDKTKYIYCYEISNNNCDLRIVDNDSGSENSLLEIESRRFSGDIFEWLNRDLVEINIKTGSPGNFSVFYSIIDKKLSKKFYFPVAVDVMNGVVLVADEDVYVTKIFNDAPSKRIEIDEDFYHTAIKWLIIDREKTYFDNNGDLYIKYKNNNDDWESTGISSHDLIIE